MKTAQTVGDFLAKCECTNIRLVKVRIKDKEYEGAEYIDPKHPDKRIRLYLIGRHPALFRKSGKWREKRGVCYRLPGDDHDWYVATYAPEHNKKIEAKYAQYHPPGITNHFMLTVWPHEQIGSRIDTHETKEYERIPMEVEYLTQGEDDGDQ